MESSWQVTPRLLSAAQVRRTVDAALDFGGRAGLAVAVVFVDDEFLRELHERFLGDPTPTDVITFDLDGGDTLAHPGDAVACEIYVSVDCARRVALRRKEPLERELALYLVHGALHLCGYDDHASADRRRMRAAEARVLKSLGHATRRAVRASSARMEQRRAASRRA